MAAELGIFALILAFVLSLSQAFFGLMGAWRGKPVWMAVSRPAVTGQFRVRSPWHFPALVYCFVHNDFLGAVCGRANSNSQLPLFYKVAALWGRARRLAVAVDLDSVHLGASAVAAFSRGAAIEFFSSRVPRCDGADQLRVHAIYNCGTSSFPFLRPDSRRPGRRGF